MYLKEKNIIHRDIKTSNILIHKNEEKLCLKLIDWNTSKIYKWSDGKLIDCCGTLSF